MVQRRRRRFGSRTSQQNARGSFSGSGIEALEGRELFSFGLGAAVPPPAIIAAPQAHTAEPVAPRENSAEVVIVAPPARLDQVELGDDVVIDIKLYAVNPTPATLTISTAGGASSGGPRLVANPSEGSRREAILEAFETVERPYYVYLGGRETPADNKPFANLLDRLESANLPRLGPLFMDMRSPSSLENEEAHDLGIMAMRPASIPLGIEFQRNPTEAPTNSNSLYDKSSHLPNLAVASIPENQLALHDALARASDDGALRAAVAFEESAPLAQTRAIVEARNSHEAALDAEARATDWGAILPLLPELSPDLEKLGEAFQTVFADLDDLGSGLVGSLADHDRFLWGAGAAGVAYYVSSYGIQRGLPARARQPVARPQRGRAGASRNSFTVLRLQPR